MELLLLEGCATGLARDEPGVMKLLSSTLASRQRPWSQLVHAARAALHSLWWVCAVCRLLGLRGRGRCGRASCPPLNTLRGAGTGGGPAPLLWLFLALFPACKPPGTCHDHFWGWLSGCSAPNPGLHPSPSKEKGLLESRAPADGSAGVELCTTHKGRAVFDSGLPLDMGMALYGMLKGADAGGLAHFVPCASGC